MTDLTLSIHRSKGRPWWPYLVFALAAFFTGAVGLTTLLFHLFERGNAGTPDISGEVVDIVTGERVSGINVCLLETYRYSGPTDAAGPRIDVRRGEVTQTDRTGIFSFDAATARLDFFQSADRYSISITEPVGDLVCGLGMEEALRRHGRVFQNEPSASERKRHYFPVSIVDNTASPPPVAYSTSFLYEALPDAVRLRTLDNPSKLRIELIPLLQRESECQGAYDTASVELCRQANTSPYAEKWRTELSHHP